MVRPHSKGSTRTSQGTLARPRVPITRPRGPTVRRQESSASGGKWHSKTPHATDELLARHLRGTGSITTATFLSICLHINVHRHSTNGHVLTQNLYLSSRGSARRSTTTRTPRRLARSDLLKHELPELTPHINIHMNDLHPLNPFHKINVHKSSPLKR